MIIWVTVWETRPKNYSVQDCEIADFNERYAFNERAQNVLGCISQNWNFLLMPLYVI